MAFCFFFLSVLFLAKSRFSFANDVVNLYNSKRSTAEKKKKWCTKNVYSRKSVDIVYEWSGRRLYNMGAKDSKPSCITYEDAVKRSMAFV